MPGLYRIHGFLIYFWANEGDEPVHVHVARGRQSPVSSKFWILEDGEVEAVSVAADVTVKELRGISEFLRSVAFDIIEAWRQTFGRVRFRA